MDRGHLASDLLADYRQAPKTGWSGGRTGKNSPHIWFANADTDNKLIAFVKRFGPVVVRSLREPVDESPLDIEKDPESAKIVAEKDMAELRKERTLYRWALTLLGELRREKMADVAVVRECITRIADGSRDWQAQRIREESLRMARAEWKPNWNFGEEAVRAIETSKFSALCEPPQGSLRAASYDPVWEGHNIICQLVNAFEVKVYVWGKTPIEGPDWDVRYGIRPLLYYILRQQYLQQRGGIAVCANVQCRELFEIERAGQRFCLDTCSQHQRQREYWAERGKKLREKRRRQRKAADKGARKRG
jgi:hypothetical protein